MPGFAFRLTCQTKGFWASPAVWVPLSCQSNSESRKTQSTGIIYLTNSIGQSSGLLNRRFGVQVPGGVPLIRIETGQVLSPD